MPLRFFLCASCRDTWIGRVGDGRCFFCASDAVDCSPWSGDGRAWFHARMADEAEPGVRKGDAVAVARYRTMEEICASLWRGIVARGNTSALLRGAP